MRPTDESGHDQLRLRFLARVIEHGFAVGLRTPEDLLRHFPPATLMAALANEPDRRARILQDTIGIRPRIALKKSPESSGEDLQIALDEGETDAATIVRLFPPADLVRFLEPTRLWAYVTEPSNFGGETRNPEVLDAIRNHTTFIIQQARTEGLISARDILVGIGSAALIDRLPREDVATVFERALADGRQDLPFTDETFFEIIPLATLVAHSPLAALWDRVIGDCIAGPLSLDAIDEETVTTAAASLAVARANRPLTVTRASPPRPEETIQDVLEPAVEEPVEPEATDDILFDETEAHPDADPVAAIVDAAGTEPHVVEPRASERSR